MAGVMTERITKTPGICGGKPCIAGHRVRVVDIVMPADRHRGELRQIADDHLGCVEQLGRQLPVRHDDDANHIAILDQSG